METTFIIFVIYPTVPFKSYYVVWKLENIVFKASIDSEFKSYYVVWKLDTHFVDETMEIRLNRTM